MPHRFCLWRRRLLAAVFTLSTAMATTVHALTPPPLVAPSSGPWDTGAGFQFDLKDKKAIKTRQSVSGIACNRSGDHQRICLLAFDEGVEARYAIVNDGAMLPHPEVLGLRADTGELDAEGAATDGKFFYVTGSHSAKRNSCESNPDSRYVVRFRVDPRTGRALRDPGGSLVDFAETGALWQVMLAQPALKPYVGERKCLGAKGQGINIEGLAVRDGRLYFGLRGPALDGTAGVLSVDAEALFGGGDTHPNVTALVVGAGRGIRDMVAVDGGFLLLAGPDDDEAHAQVGWTVLQWDGRPAPQAVQPKVLARLDLSGVQLRSCDKEIKPEAITVLAESKQSYTLLVLSDGMCDGGPMTFVIPR